MKALNKIFLTQINGFSVENHESKSESIYEEKESKHSLFESKQNDNFKEIWQSQIYFQKDLVKSTNNNEKLMQTISRRIILT